MPLKSVLEVTQGRWKWRHSIDRIEVPIRLLLNCGRIKLVSFPR